LEQAARQERLAALAVRAVILRLAHMSRRAVEAAAPGTLVAISEGLLLAIT
jgi:hypothetical protein